MLLKSAKGLRFFLCFLYFPCPKSPNYFYADLLGLEFEFCSLASAAVHQQGNDRVKVLNQSLNFGMKNDTKNCL